MSYSWLVKSVGSVALVSWYKYNIQSWEIECRSGDPEEWARLSGILHDIVFSMGPDGCIDLICECRRTGT